MKIEIRNARPGDEDGIVLAGVRGWQDTYDKILPAKFLADLDKQIPHRMEEWKKHLSKPDICSRTFVAEADGRVVGFCTGNKSRHEKFPEHGELYAIYVLKEFRGYGVGRKLTHALAKYFLNHGYNKMLIGVLEENHSGRKFYEGIGGGDVAKVTFPVEGVKYPEVLYEWTNLSLLVKSLSA